MGFPRSVSDRDRRFFRGHFELSRAREVAIRPHQPQEFLTMTPDIMKISAAVRALAFVEPGMRIGLGTGSTAARFIDLLGQEVKKGLDVICVPTSEVTRAQALALGIPLTTLDDVPFLDLTIDGADEIDKELRLIKGGGGALLREKIVATASDRMLVIADESKLVDTLGAFPLPVEVVLFGLNATRNMIEMLAADAGCQGDIRLRLKADGSAFMTDSGNAIFDCHFGRIDDPESLDEALKFIPGVVENGLFLGIADAAVIGGREGISVLSATYGEEAEAT
jgi:ribose 5-phosphate isomerase A